MTMNYDERIVLLSNDIKKRVEFIAKRTKVPHDTIWSDLNVLLSDIVAYKEAIKNVQ